MDNHGRFVQTYVIFGTYATRIVGGVLAQKTERPEESSTGPPTYCAEKFINLIYNECMYNLH